MNIRTYDMAFEGNNIWFLHNRLNILFCFNITVGQVVKTIPITTVVADYDGPYFLSILYNKGKLYLIPWNDSKIVIYDIVCEDFKSISIPFMKRPFFVNGIFNKDYLYILPCASTEIFKLNCIDNQLDKVVDLKGYVSTPWIVAESVVCIEGSLYALSMYGSSEILLFDADSEKVSRIETEEEDIGDPRIVYRKPYIYMSTNGKKKHMIKMINPDTGEVVKAIEKRDNKYSEIWSVFDKYILIDYEGSEKYDIYDHQLNYLGDMDYADVLVKKNKYSETTIGIWRQNETGLTTLFNNCDGSISIFKDKCFDNKDTYYLKGDEAIIKEVLHNHLQSGLRETDDFNLQDMLNIIMNK